MIDELFSIGSFSISPFGVMLVLALLAGYWQLRRQMLRYGVGTDEDASSIVFTCGILGILGGKIYYAILVGDWRMIFDRAGIVWYGCLIGGALALFWVLRRRQLPVGRTFDAAAPALPFGYAVGRVGCLLVGDDYGVPTSVPWGMKFPVGLPPSTAGQLRRQFGVEVDPSIADSTLLAVHPTQIYSTLVALVIWGLALWLGKRAWQSWRPGALFLVVLGMLSVERFMVEILRAKDDRFFGHFTVAQVISVAIIVLVVSLLLMLRNRQTRPAT